ncbi:MAG: hypothetical protein IJ071_12060 [Ruminococcus sp.]|nr:hypothetical protein [Ruminococcus sp.]
MKKFICILTLTAALLAGCSSGGSGSSNTQTGAVNGQSSQAESSENGGGAANNGGAVNSNGAANNASNRDKQRENADDPDNSAIGFISSLTYFSTADEFLSSPLAVHLEQSGYKPLSLTFDENKYMIQSVYADSNFYSYSLYENESGANISYTFIFGSSRTRLEDLSVTGNDTIELGENGSGAVSVLAVREASNADNIQYLTYMPVEGCEARLSCTGADQAQLMKYFGDITPTE